jgi:hypothetical protein
MIVNNYAISFFVLVVFGNGVEKTPVSLLLNYLEMKQSLS